MYNVTIMSSYVSQVLNANSIAVNYLFFLLISWDEAWVGQKGGGGEGVLSPIDFLLFSFVTLTARLRHKNQPWLMAKIHHKGTLTKIFDFRFSSRISSPQAPDYKYHWGHFDYLLKFGKISPLKV